MEERPGAFATELRVRYAETDQMGVVYHTHYLVWCEVARTGLIRERGTSYAELERQGLILAVADARIRYHASARYDDLIRIYCWPGEVKSRTVTFEYAIERVDTDGTTRLATAATQLIALTPDGATRRLPAELIEALRAAIPR